MRTLTRRCLLASTSLLWPLALSAQDLPDPLQILRAMEVEGPPELTRDDVAGALAADPETLDLLRRGLDERAAYFVAQRLNELYVRGGWPDANCRASVKDGILFASVTAGPRYRCGDLRFEGVTALDVEQLRSRFSEAPEYEGGAGVPRILCPWNPEEYCSTDDEMRQRMAAVVRLAYRDLGCYGVKVDVRFQPDGERMHALFVVSSEGTEVRVRTVRLLADGDPTAVDIAQSVTPAEAELLTSVSMAQLRRRILASGRFGEAEIVVPDGDSALLDPLRIRVTPLPRVESLVEPSALDVAQMQKVLERLQDRLARGETIRIATELTSPIELGPLQVLPGHFEARIGSEGVTAHADAVQIGSAKPAAASIGFAKRRIWWSVGERGSHVVSAEPLRIQLNMNTELDAEGMINLRWGFGFGSIATSKSMCSLSLHPGTASRVLTKAARITRDGEVLDLQFSDFGVRFTGDGEIENGNASIPSSYGPVELSWGEGLGAPPASLPPTSDSLWSALAIEPLAFWLAATSPDDPISSHLVRAMLPLVRAPEDDHEEPKRPKKPSLGRSPSGGEMANLAAGLAEGAVSREVSDGMAKLLGAFAYALRGESRMAEATFEDLADPEQQHGPVLLGLAAFAWSRMGNAPLARRFATLADERAAFDAIYDELAGYTAALHYRADLPVRIGAAWRADAELANWLGTLPTGEAGDLVAWKKGLRHAWEHGGAAAARKWLRSM